MNYAVEISKLNFAYAPRQQPVVVLNELKLEQGASHLIYGESGCGKSTLLNLISGVIRAPAGAQIRVMHEDLSQLSASACDRFRAVYMAFIFQQFNLIPYLSARENIELPQKLNPHRQFNVESLATLAERLQIAHVLDQPAVTLSHGQQQRVAAARALFHHSALVIADEPTSALDNANSAIFMDILLERVKHHGTTLIVVSHDLRFKNRFDNVINFKNINKAS